MHRDSSRLDANVQIDKGQLSRWENESPRPTLENLGRLLVGYGATLSDLAITINGASQPIEDRGPTDEELLRSLADAIRRVEGLEGWKQETESRVKRLEEDLTRTTG